MENLSRREFPSEALVLVKKADRPRDVRTGDRVRLNSGGPKMTVVEVSGDTCIAAWRDGAGAQEEAFPIACVHYAFD